MWCGVLVCDVRVFSFREASSSITFLFGNWNRNWNRHGLKSSTHSSGDYFRVSVIPPNINKSIRFTCARAWCLLDICFGFCWWTMIPRLSGPGQMEMGENIAPTMGNISFFPTRNHKFRFLAEFDVKKGADFCQIERLPQVVKGVNLRPVKYESNPYFCTRDSRNDATILYFRPHTVRLRRFSLFLASAVRTDTEMLQFRAWLMRCHEQNFILINELNVLCCSVLDECSFAWVHFCQNSLSVVSSEIHCIRIVRT